ncbi:unnamed protein product [Periconia digitata]|uniref:Uncharacterized protein n=1 Tax=Periconia digitata TaxID=1303443 RepID=A0A9W4UGG9_9PLEO|nr:unnamed protein product [Periconia digitata]
MNRGMARWKERWMARQPCADNGGPSDVALNLGSGSLLVPCEEQSSQQPRRTNAPSAMRQPICLSIHPSVHLSIHCTASSSQQVLSASSQVLAMPAALCTCSSVWPTPSLQGPAIVSDWLSDPSTPPSPFTLPPLVVIHFAVP